MGQTYEGNSAIYMFVPVKAIIRTDEGTKCILQESEGVYRYGFVTNDMYWQADVESAINSGNIVSDRSIRIHGKAYDLLDKCEKNNILEIMGINSMRTPVDFDIIATVKWLADDSYWALMCFRM
jgi:hypothetical protein